MACNTLRIDRGDGSPVVEYRIENGHVERRAAESVFDETTDYDWTPLTPEELSAHVLSGTALSHWLRLRMGIFRLVRACNSDATSAMYPSKVTHFPPETEIHQEHKH